MERESLGSLAAEAIALRYVTRFQCTGPACPASCCVGWHVFVDRDSHRRLRKALDRNSADREMFRASVERMPEAAASDAHHARMRMTADARCPFLRADDLCTIHTRFGEELLPSACATYPRAVALVGRRLEVAASLSCPEAARLCLLGDASMEIVPAPPDAVPRDEVQHHVALRDESPYELAFESVREALLALLERDDRSLATRLAFVVWLGRNSAAFLHEKIVDLDPIRLSLELERVGMRPMQDAFARDLDVLDPPLVPAVGLVIHLLRRRLADSANPRLRELVARVLPSLAADAASTGASGVLGLTHAFTARRDRLVARHGNRLDALLARWAINHVWKEPWIGSSSLLVYAATLALRFAVLRFLVLGHPALATAVADPRDGASSLDVITVDVVQRFSRAVDHDAAFLEQLEETLRNALQSGIGDVLGLLRL